MSDKGKAPTQADMFNGLFQAMVGAGIDPSTVRVYPAVLDWTWGERVGYVVQGEHAHRAAQWLASWIRARLGPHSCYERQIRGTVEGEGEALVQMDALPPEMRVYPRGQQHVRGVLVAEAYYPGAD